MNLGIDNNIINQYLQMLSDEIPEFIIEYANVPQMQRLKGISMISACEHTKLIPYNFFHNRYEHSIGVALIVWNFTKDRKKTIAGLYHDIATPSFSHVIDYLHGDYEKQESTEKLTEIIINNSNEIMNLLKRDHIEVDDIKDYHIYSIADNDSPKLSADRLEYTLSDGLVTQDAFDLESIYRIYKDIIVMKNEQGEEEIGFRNIDIAEEYVERASKLWRLFSGNNENNIVMELWKDILKNMILENYLLESDLYKYSEDEIVNKIRKCPNKKIRDAFKIFANSNKIGRSDTKITDKYCISIKVKKRYTDPLVLMNNTRQPQRISKVSDKGRYFIKDIINFEDSKYAYLNIHI